MTGRVLGKIALITGAARGQGRSHAYRLAEEGADIIAVDICEQVTGASPYPGATETDLAETVAGVEGRGRRVIAFRADVRDHGALKAAIDEGVSQFGRLDIVAANAGITTPHAQPHEVPDDMWRLQMDNNVTGVWSTTKAAIPHIIAGGRGGSIILTSSTAGFRPYLGVSPYVVAKHAVVGIMRGLALDLAQYMIRVNTIHPTSVNTNMIMYPELWRRFRPDAETVTADDFAEGSSRMHALPVPWVEPEDISNALVYLASDESRYVTGITLPVDAGASLK